jgi:ABC-type histidine transport system ATPase subunit
MMFGRRRRSHDHGGIIEEGRPGELMSNPRNERTRSFLRMVMGEA